MPFELRRRRSTLSPTDSDQQKNPFTSPKRSIEENEPKTNADKIRASGGRKSQHSEKISLGSKEHKRNSNRHRTHHHQHYKDQLLEHHHHDGDILFMIPRDVILQYGPYSVQGLWEYRVERLQGLQKALKKMGAKVTLAPLHDHFNRVCLWYMDTVIFTCAITDLIYGGDGQLDTLCIQAAHAFDQTCRRAIHGLRNRIQNDEKQRSLMSRFCPCINPDISNICPSTNSENDAKDKALEATVVRRRKGAEDEQEEEGDEEEKSEGQGEQNLEEEDEEGQTVETVMYIADNEIDQILKHRYGDIGIADIAFLLGEDENVLF